MLSAKEQQTQWKSERLQKSAINLYNTLARALARLIFIFNGSMSQHPSLSERANKFIKRLVASGYTAKSIDNILGGVQKQSQRFERSLQQARDDLAIKTGETADRLEEKIDDIGEVVRGYNTEISEIKQSLQRDDQDQGIYIFNVIHQNLLSVPSTYSKPLGIRSNKQTD